MKIDKRMLNLLGLLVIVAVLGLGVSGIVMPMYQQVQSANGDIADAGNTNTNYRTKLTQLTAAEGRKSQIDRSIDELRVQLPSTREDESTLRVIAAAAKKYGLEVESDAFSDAVAFAPREGADAEGGSAPPPAPPADTNSKASASTNSAESDAGSLPSADPPTDPRQQTTVTLEFAVKDEPSARKFLQELQGGPRLLLVTDAKLERAQGLAGTSYQGKLTVTLQMFTLTEGQ